LLLRNVDVHLTVILRFIFLVELDSDSFKISGHTNGLFAPYPCCVFVFLAVLMQVLSCNGSFTGTSGAMYSAYLHLSWIVRREKMAMNLTEDFLSAVEVGIGSDIRVRRSI
jgi:hypothetical protein